MTLLYISMLCFAACVGSISADDHVTVPAKAGSTVALPCKLNNTFTETPHIRWKIDGVLVFERSSDGTAEGEGYEGRVDVPEDELRKGNCSLVLENVRLTDDGLTDNGVYKSFVVEHVDRNKAATQELSRVKLSVYTQIISARVGSTAVLPCEWKDPSIQTSHVEWNIDSETVFERKGKESFPGEGYEGRVEVPEDELRKGNCSLVLRNVGVTDEAIYGSSMLVEHRKEPVLVQKVKLSVSVPQILSARVGSTAVLPCEWRDPSIQTPHVKWYIDSEIVFERKGKESFPGEGYEGRVDVPEDELRKGNCSLVLRNVSVADEAIYRSSMLVEHRKKHVLVQKVKLSVSEKRDKSKKDAQSNSGEAGINCPRLLILIVSLLVCFLF